jgi:hypothetical protein
VILAIIGSRKFSNPKGYRIAEAIIAAEVMRLEWNGFVSGGAPGVDIIIEDYCEELDRGFRRFLPENPRWEPSGYKARNILIAEACDELMCIRDSGSPTYGSGWTADYTETLGKPVTRITIS